MRIEEYSILRLTNDIKQIGKQFGVANCDVLAAIFAPRLYDMGWRHGSTIVDQEAACTAVDYSFRGGAIMFATKIKAKMKELSDFSEGEPCVEFSASDIDEMLRVELQKDKINPDIKDVVVKYNEHLERWAIIEYSWQRSAGRPLCVAQYYISGKMLISGEDTIYWVGVPRGYNFSKVEMGFETKEAAEARLEELKALRKSKGVTEK